MQKIQFDSGVQEYRLSGGGVLRFNPCDPNLYSRFLDAADKIQALEQELGEKAKNASQPDGRMAVELLVEADKKMKTLLQQVFGEENDFDRALGGVNLLAVAGNGERVITNLFAAGCHMILFTTGRGTPVGSGVPTVKIATNHSLATRKTGWIDFDSSPVLEGKDLDDDFFDYLLKVASGEQTQNERKGYREISIFKDGVTL